MSRPVVGPPGRRKKLTPINPVTSSDGVEENTEVIRKDDGTLEVRLLNGSVVVVTKEGILSFTSPSCASAAASPAKGLTTTPTSQSSAASSSSSSPSCCHDKFRWSDLTVLQVLGSGAQGLVYQVEHAPTKTFYALKVINLNSKVRNKTIQQELSRIFNSHPQVVASYEAFYVEGSLKILMEYMDLGTLQDIVNLTGPLPADVLSGFTQQNLHGFAHLHAAHIVHRDMKPNNLLVNSLGQAKIADFGMSTALDPDTPNASTVVGATGYMAPERVRGEGHDMKSDIWSLGVTVAQCALGVFPFLSFQQRGPSTEPAAPPSELSSSSSGSGNNNNNNNPFERPLNIFDLSVAIAEEHAEVDFAEVAAKVREYYPLRRAPDVRAELVDFVRQCTATQPERRPSCEALLAHPFITTYSDKVDLKLWLLEKHPPLTFATVSSCACSLKLSSKFWLMVFNGCIVCHIITSDMIW